MLAIRAEPPGPHLLMPVAHAILRRGLFESAQLVPSRMAGIEVHKRGKKVYPKPLQSNCSLTKQIPIHVAVSKPVVAAEETESIGSPAT